MFVSDIYGKERDDMIGRSKIILNIHKGESDQFEPVRVSYLLNNRCFVLSEHSSCYPYEGVDLCFIKREEIVERCRYFLSHQEEIHQKREETYQQFKKNYPMTEMIRSFL